jgi:outer membrane protein OmpA-like peptidoglycan-associated protein
VRGGLLGAAIALAAAAVPASAGAQVLSRGFDAELYRPSASPNAILSADAARAMRLGEFSLALAGGWVRDPLRLCFTDARGCVSAVEDRVTGWALASLGLSVVEIGLAFPFVPFQDNDFDGSDPALGTDPVRAAAGDLRAAAKVAFLPRAWPAGVGLRAEAAIPTGDAAQYAGEGGPVVTGTLLFDVTTRPFRLALNGGFRWRGTPVDADNVHLGNEIVFAAGAEVFVVAERVGLLADVHGAVGLVPGGASAAERPVELLGGLDLRPVRGVAVTVAAGGGLTEGYGAPGFRAALGVRYSRVEDDRDGDGLVDRKDRCPDDPEDKDGFEDGDGCPEVDNDGDGVLDRADRCPDDPEDKDGFEDDDGCPEADNDRDGVLDPADRCPLDPEDKDGFEDDDGCPDPDDDKDGVLDAADRCPRKPEDKDGFEDDDGCPDPDNDKDGLLDPADKCPDQPEDKDGFEDDDGCPDLDNDKDGFLDPVDKCPDEPEVINGFEDDDGCPDKGKTLVALTTEKIEIKEKVHFDTDKAVIKKVSYELLDQVATLLRNHPEIEKVRIEGHTDDRGTDEYNVELSRKRAAAVRDHLVGLGIDPARLESEGYGKSKPLVPSKRPADRALNRRVEFVIVEKAP